MELYYVMCIIDRDRSEQMLKLFRKQNLTLVLASLAHGTAKSEHLLLYDLRKTEKAVLCAIATRESTMQLFREAEETMYIDIPGNGIMLSIPLKSVGGGRTLEFLTKGQKIGGGIPAMEFEHELIVAIISEGYSDTVMDAARAAGAAGGTVLHAKGTGRRNAEKFMNVSLAQNRDIVYILAGAEQKTTIMKRIQTDCGKGHPADAICFSMPVSAVTGIRRHQANLPEEASRSEVTE